MLVVPSETTMLTLIGEHPDDPLRGALAVFEAAMQIVDERPDLLAHRRELFERHPTLLQQHLATFHDLEDTLTRILTRELSNRTEYRRLHSDTAAADEATATVITQAPRCVTSSENGRTVNGQAPEQICSIRHYS